MTDRQTDRQAWWIQYIPPNSVAGGHKNLTSMTLNLHENGCKFSQTWLIVILVRHCIFENTDYIFRGNKDVWRYQKYVCNVIFEKKTRWAFYPDGRFAPHYPINVQTVHQQLHDLIIILVRHCIFENTYYIFRGNKDVWRYQKYFCNVIFEKKNDVGVLPRWAFCPTLPYKQRVLMHGHQGWNVRHGLCHIYMIYVYIYMSCS